MLHEPSAVIVDSLRLSDRELSTVLAKVIERAGVESDVPETVQCDWPRMLVHICHVKGQCTTFLVKPRDVHAQGMVFLHGSFVHQGASCAALVRHADGTPTQLPATISDCRHLTGRVHEVTATFDEPIDPREYVCADGSPLTAS